MENYNLKNIRTWNSRNGYGMSATLLINEKEVCDLYDIGDGSQPKLTAKNEVLFNQLNRKIHELPELFIEEYGCELKIDMPLFIDMLHYALVNKTEFKLLSQAC